MSKNIAKVGVLALATALAVGLSGCTVNFMESSSSDGSMHNGMMGNTENGEFSGQDIMFAQMMIPHHQQAVDMGTLAETRASSPEVRELAAQIKAEQAPEIELMKSWLDETNAPEMMDHEMPMGGMLSEEEMIALENATGAEFDRLYLEGMIEHHKGAISMAQMILRSTNSEVKTLGEAIVSSQTEQITYMEQLLAK